MKALTIDINNPKLKKAKNKQKGIQIGLITQNQLQVINPVSFKPINKMVNIVANGGVRSILILYLDI